MAVLEVKICTALKEAVDGWEGHQWLVDLLVWFIRNIHSVSHTITYICSNACKSKSANPKAATRCKQTSRRSEDDLHPSIGEHLQECSYPFRMFKILINFLG